MAAAKPILYSAWISFCSFRVRIALNLKGVDYEYRAVTRDDPDYEKINPIKYVPAFVDGDFVVSDSLAIILYLEDKYLQHPLLPQDLKKKAINLQIANIVCSSIQPLQCYAVIGLVDGKLSSDESLQIVRRYIDKGFRAIEKLLEGCDSKYATGDEIQLIANIVCSSIQPLQAQGYAIIGVHGGRLSPDEILQVIQYYIDKGFRAIEKILEGRETKYATGDDVQLGDVFLAPQIHAGIHRFQIDMSKYPILARLHDAYMEIPAFQDALPENQPDAPKS